MRPPAIPPDESVRLASLREHRVLDTEVERGFDELTAFAAFALDVPIALVSLVDAGRLWFKSHHGLDVRETPREVSFCGHVVADAAELIVPDTLEDERFADNPLVLGGPAIRFYAGVPLRARDGAILGTLCAIDRRPRELSPVQLAMLRSLAAQASDQLELRRRLHELQAAQARAAELESRLGAALQSMYEGVLVLNREGRIVLANPSAERILARPSEVLLRGDADVWRQGIHADGSPFEPADYPAQACLRTGEAVRDVVMGITHAEGVRWIEISAQPLRAPDGELTGVLASFADITERHAAQEDIARRSRFLEEVLSSMPGIILGVFDVACNVVNLFGDIEAVGVQVPPAALRSVAMSGLASPHDQAALMSAMQDCVAGKTTFLHTSRDDRQFDVRVVPLERASPDGGVGLLIATDVTERDVLRERMARQSRLVTTGTLAAGIGHEINNPLQYVIGNLDVAIDELRSIAGPSPSSRIADIVTALVEARQGSDRIREVVRGLRTFAREEDVLVPTDVHAAASIARNMAMHELRHRVKLIEDLHPVAAVLADEARLSQILVNLLVNAAQCFTERDPARNLVTLRARQVEAHVVLEVSDNGPGIGAPTLARIFDPFFTTKPVGQGTGLGLAICQSIATSLGTEIECDTQLGVGTTFRIRLATAPPNVEEPVPSPISPALRRGRILVVDDEPMITALVSRLLASEHDVVTTEDSRIALAMLLDPLDAFDVVYCDMMMPFLDGAGLYRRVTEARPELAERFVFISGGASAHHLASFLDQVPNERLDKPFEAKSLRRVARRLVDHAGPAQ